MTTISPPKLYNIIARGPLELIVRKVGELTNVPLRVTTRSSYDEQYGPMIHAQVWLDDSVKLLEWFNANERDERGVMLPGGLSWYHSEEK